MRKVETTGALLESQSTTSHRCTLRPVCLPLLPSLAELRGYLGKCSITVESTLKLEVTSPVPTPVEDDESVNIQQRATPSSVFCSRARSVA